ncbi:ATP-dependent helicase [Streptomyces xiaopingdaonensis]|uniref:ATP-dependent helicase n=1 Tax=Streptomyces xiaopingdaonensis TaxID=1565415 RepID=UPI00187319A6|nr:ATP-dependent DNA helicase [Streptomyces xiaopingdaonensis]
MHVSPSTPADPASAPRPGSAPGAYRLVRTVAEPARAPALDAQQRAVVDHREGPRLVLAGPGTGKTTTLVESVVERIRAGADPERLLVLTFSRRAAVELRDATAARLAAEQQPGPALRPPLTTTFHSYCYALVRAHQDAALFAEPLRLLSGPEQDLHIRELLAGQQELGAIRWPDELRACLTTRGFADEVRAVLARSRELGLGPRELAAFAERADRPDWQAAAAFLAEYLDVLDAQGVLDYAELVHRAVLLSERPEVAAELRGAYDAVFVDEYQDTDPSQVRLLRALTCTGSGRTAPGSSLVAFGDPDQSIYAFRGADVNGILDFPSAFLRADGRPAPVSVLRTGRRFGTRLLAATREVARRMPLGRLPADSVRAHRALTAAERREKADHLRVLTFPTPGAELDNIADLLRRAHLEDGVPWREMAVLVRAGGRSLPSMRRALVSAGVPVDVEGDDVPLRHEPAVAPLLAALRWAAEGTPEDAGTEPALSLLSSPLGGLDAADLRRLGRALREEERAGGARVPRPSDVLLAEALAEPERLGAHGAHERQGKASAPARAAYRLGTLLARASGQLAAGAGPQEALWTLWDGTGWPQRLERTARRGGPAGRNADRDLDAVCTLFEVAARAEERTGGRGARNFLEELEAQDIAADTLAARALRPESVRLLTAHRAKGLEWRLVVVAGVQEGLWPDLRRRGSLLEADRIGRDGIAAPLPPGALLAEERRLFYTAVTRARERLVVTAVRAATDDGDQPSRFLAELGEEPVAVHGRPRRPLSVAGLVAELRATTVDPAASPALREAAAARLARLAALRDDDGNALVPQAHPTRWWGLYEPTRSEAPVRDPERPVALSGSALDQLANVCSLQWFLGREVKADTPSTAAQGFGNVVHVLADEVASGSTPADLDVLLERLDSVWEGLSFEAPFRSVQERENARAALERFLRWHVAERDAGRETAGSEHEFDVTLKAGEYEVRIRGTMDRIERDASGRAYVVDFKTGRAKPASAEVASHPQLAVYQLAVREGAADGLLDTAPPEQPRPGGASLVHLRLGAPAKEGGDALPAVQHQPPLGEGSEGEGTDAWVGDLLAEAAGRVLDERFTPSPGRHCEHCAFRRACSARPEGRQVVE